MPALRPLRLALCLIASAAALASPAVRATGDEQCPERVPRAPAAPTPPYAAAENPPTDIRARTLSSIAGGISEFTGNVEVREGNKTLTADRLRYDETTRESQASGNVSLTDATGTRFENQEIRLNLDSRIGAAGPGRFHLPNDSARGDAQRIDFEGPYLTRFTRARYTTCPPGQDSWFLNIRELELDTRHDIGTAHHATLDFQGLPLFYLPYLDFPLSNRRKSGFLIPRLGSSTQRGLEVATPYYLNLAPNYDDTVTPHYMSERGMQLQNEFRYLTRQSEGKLDLEVLPHDRMANGDDRAAGAYLHKQIFSPRWSGNVDIQGVSDKQYFNDFGNSLEITSQTYLPQIAQLDYHGPTWSFSTLASAFQTIDPTIASTDRPYARLPQIDLALNLPEKPNRLNYSLDSQAVNFERSVGVTGERLSLNPAVSLPLSNSYAFFIPKVGVRQIAYRLTDAPEATPTLTRGVVSLDSGMYFERDSRWGNRLFTQTLEPRLYYLYIPYKNQDSLPVFDTGVPDLNFSNLFRDNRFVGGDRIGDSNQITAAATTRFIDNDSGAERARLSLGRIYYLHENQVNLPPGPSGAAASDIVGEATMMLARHWYARSTAGWDRAGGHLQQYSYYVQYNPARNRIVNIGKQFTRGAIEQSDVSAAWPIAGRWSLRARSLYSWRDRRNVDSYAGVEYKACCWALRILGGRRLSIDTAHNNAATQTSSIMFELELTGLSKLGNVPDSPLHQSVFSFPPPTAAAGPTVP
ncbi:MAG: LPS-assembly protein LptD [Sulfuricaulis sp.]